METLKITRMKAGISQKELSDLTGLTPATINNLELGRRYPQEETIKKIETIIGKVNWISTRLSGAIGTGFGENESPEDKVIKSIYEYIKSSSLHNKHQRFKFLKEFLHRFEFKENLMQKVNKINAGKADLSIFTKKEMTILQRELPGELLRRK